ncbi:leucine-rich repeat protein [Bacteroides timonensis]|uniref:leucine-rich repeat protein n=1 Tax=Bacteroides timonensis TaxID=1470345 RepID=UPI0004B485FA|nr:leucine-rich repeat protein [Bacteroides timonensis]
MRTKHLLITPVVLLMLAVCIPLLTACQADHLPGVDDDGNEEIPAEELVGKPVNFGGLTVTEVATDAGTRAVTRTDVAYEEPGATMTVKMTVTVADGTTVTKYADYTYRAASIAIGTRAGWVADDPSTALCWRHISNNHTFTAYLPALTDEEKNAARTTTGKLERTIVLPDEFTADNYLKYDYLSQASTTSAVSSAPITFSGMKHLMARIEVTGKNDKIYHTKMGLLHIFNSGKTTSSVDTETVVTDEASKGELTGLWKDGNTFRGFLMPGQVFKNQETALVSAADNATYSITAQPTGTETKLTAGQVLKVEILKVPNLTEVTNSAAGSLDLSGKWEGNNSKIAISGPLNDQDISTLAAYLKANPAIKGVYLPETVTDIGCRAFEGATSLQEVYLPQGLQVINANAFKNTGLTSIDFPEGLTTIGDHAFYITKLTKVVLPQSLTKLDVGAFQENSLLTVAILLDGLTEIGSSVFFRCTALKEVHLPKTLKTIGSSAFSNCNSLTSISLPESLNSIGQKVFESCGNLNTVVFNSSASFDYQTFFNCLNLTNLVIPDVDPYWGWGNHFDNTAIGGGNGVLFLTDVNITTEAQLQGGSIGIGNSNGITWKTIHYGYTGEGDVTNPENYLYHYPTNSNP